MANSTPDTPPVMVALPAGMSTEQFAQFMSMFADKITSGITAGINEARPKKVAMGQYDPKSPFQPNKKLSKRLVRASYQNGTRLNPAQLYNSEIELLNRISRSGRYINRLIEVIVRQDGADETVEIRYKNKTIDERMEHRGAYNSLRDMLEKIVAEQDALIAEEVGHKEARKMFSSAATREAREKAAERQSLES